MAPSPRLPHEDTWLARLEALTLRLEAPLYRWIRDAFLFLFYHTGTLAFWTLILLAVTGLYVTLFYRFSFTGSYASIEGIDSNVIGHVIRGMHRYLADLLVLFVLLHAWRMFVQNRFKGPRLLAWVSGVALLFVVWVIGVTGFWMLADVRSQWLHQWLLTLLAPLRAGRAVILNFLLPWEENNGWLYMVTLFFLHVGLSIGLIFVYWLHIRHLNRPRWFPAQPWLVAVAVLAALTALVVPVSRLPIWDFTRLPELVRLNVFYLFWLPEVLVAGRVLLGFLLVLLLVGLLPWWWRPRLQAPPVQLAEEQCIGCTLCARDCPYNALEMVPREGPGPRLVALLHPERCVGCGICVGSCPTDALRLPIPQGDPDHIRTRIRQALQGRPQARLVFACHRHIRMHPDLAAAPPATPEGRPVAVVGLSCIGALHPDVLALAWQEGAAEVQVIGCPAEDCPERYGNNWLDARLHRARKPWLRARWREKPLRVDWVPPTSFPEALRAAMPGNGATGPRLIPPGEWRAWLPRPAFWKAAFLLALMLVLVVLGNRWVYAGPPWAQQATVQIAVHHQPGRPLAEAQPRNAPAGEAPGLYVAMDGRLLAMQPVAAEGTVWAFLQRQIAPGTHTLEAWLTLPGESWLLLKTEQNWEPRRVYTFQFRDRLPGGDPERGRQLFFEQVPGKNTGCRLCHSLNPGERRVGPSLAGIATRAETRVPGMSAREYLYQSIVEPDAYVVPGYPAGVMPPNYRELLTEEDIQDLVAFLLTLK